MRNSKSALEKVNEYLKANPEASNRAACEAVGVAEPTYYKARSNVESVGKLGRKARKILQTGAEEIIVATAQIQPVDRLQSILIEAIKEQVDLTKAFESVVNKLLK